MTVKTASDLKLLLDLLEQERVVASTTALADDPRYMADLEQEILATRNKDVRTEEALTLMVGVLGIATAAFLWSSSRLLVQVKSWLANWLVEHDILWPLNDDAPWWLLTHYPAANDMFTWLDGFCILAYILGGGLVVGLTLVLCVRLAAGVARNAELSWQRLALALIPLAGMSIFLGLSMLTLGHLKAERVSLEWVAPVRVALLVLGSGFSAWLGARLLLRSARLREVLGYLLFLLPVALIDAIWAHTFF